MAFSSSYLIKETSRNFLRNPSLTVATVLTVAISLSMIGLAVVSRQSVSNLSERYKEEVEFIIWLKDPVTECDDSSEDEREVCISNNEKAYANTKELISKELAESSLVADSVFVDKEATYKDFIEFYSQSQEILELVDADTMPESYNVTPFNTDSAVIDEFREKFAEKPGVRDISAAEDLIQDVVRFSNISSWLTLFAAALAFVASVLLMYNSIRTAVFARRKEIEVMRLVGATKWFIRIPFMLESLLQGLIGAIVGVFFVCLMNYGLLPEIENIGPKYAGLQLGGGELSVISIILVMIGCGLGAIAAGVAVSKYLDA